MPESANEQRLRDLECDRLMAAGLFMGAAAIAATRLALRLPATTRWFEADGASVVLAPLIALGALITSALAFLIAAGARRRPAAALAAFVGAALTAAATPFLHRSLASFSPDVSPAWSASIVSFAVFGLAASIAIQEQRPTTKHAAISAAITVFALFQAAIDGSGVFATILACMGIAFFTLWRAPAA